MSILKQPLEVDYVEGIKKNNTKLIQRIYTRFLPRIAYYIRQNGGSQAEAEDTFSDAIEVILRKIRDQSLELHCSFYTYLFEVCKRLWSKVKRRKKFHSQQSFEQATQHFLLIEEGRYLSAFQECFNLYEEKWQYLPPNSQRLLKMAIVEHKSMREIAQVMGYKSEGYARKRKHQCVRQLKELIQLDARYEELVKEN